MHPKIMYGLLIGCIGLLLNIPVAAGFGCCGPLISILAGGIAGLLAVRKGNAPTKSVGAKWGIVAGSIAGGLVLVGQVLGGIGAVFISSTDKLMMESLASATGQFGFAGALIIFCVLGVVLAILAGAGAGYWGTRESPSYL